MSDLVGSYRSPPLRKGMMVRDVYSGDVQVAGMTDAPIPWPGYNYNKGLHTGLLPVLIGDLVRAVCEEEEGTVAHYWGVSLHIVNRWKEAIAWATDSNQVAVNLAIKRVDPDFRKRYGYRE